MEINWLNDYKNEFICPKCNSEGLRLSGKDNKKIRRVFWCNKCKKRTYQHVKIKFPNAITGINWMQDFNPKDFNCPNPNCNSRNMSLSGSCYGKQKFRCKICKTECLDSTSLRLCTMSRYLDKVPIHQFSFQDNNWDVRAIKPSSDDEGRQLLFLNFETINPDWFVIFLKQYIYHICKRDESNSKIEKNFYYLRLFSLFLKEKGIEDINSINRELILDYLVWHNTVKGNVREKVLALRDFFKKGNINNWFKIDQDVIRDKDLPKAKNVNPDPLTDLVREQIENNLHKLPDPIARMWLIAFFAAMRISELALLKKDCLVQDGSYWSIVWAGLFHSKNFHEQL